MDKKSGSIKTNGKIAFVPQTAFLLNASFRDNICFGQNFDQKKYEDAVVSCRLVDDLETFTGGDLTEIGERGINLSGGQKQRVSLARAVYSDADIYLIDDALSALDAEVGRQIFDGVLKRKFAAKTIIMVTHAHYILDQVDEVLVMRDGEIKASGHFSGIKTHQEYLRYSKTEQNFRASNADESKQPDKQNQNSTKPQDKGNIQESDMDEKKSTISWVPPKNLSRQNMAPNEQFSENEKDKVQHLGSTYGFNFEKERQKLRDLSLRVSKDREQELTEAGKLTTKETKTKGFTGAKVYVEYFRNFNFILLFLVFILYVCFAGLRIVSDYWLSWWAGASISGYTYSDYAHVYVYFVIALIVILILRVWLISTGSRRAGQLLNKQFMNGMLVRPLSYFDTTPVGVILNRATKDMSETDINLPNMIQHTFFNTLFIASVIVIIGIANPVILIFLAFLMI